ncbi:PmbA protein [Anaerotaenia torta]|uniref:metallopeptidase TldD-related protein n=1 Tax=Anaerotaenia torta TaxID=433293 RepID=UPI003D21217C
MIKELYKEIISEISINVTGTRIDSIRKKNLTKCGCRVYDNGYIGIAGCYGEPTRETWSQAVKNLSDQTPYPYEPEKDKQRIRDLRQFDISEEEYIRDMERLLDILREEYPQFLLSNKMSLTETYVSLTNDAGLNYVNYDKTIDAGLLVKHKDSVNVIDSCITYISREYNLDAMLKEARSALDGYLAKCTLPSERMPVILLQDEMLGKFTESLNGEAIGRGISLFQDKRKMKVFHEEFSLCQNRSEDQYHVPFFDMEGTVSEGDRFTLIENGIIKDAFTDKKNSQAFSLPLTGAAGGQYDDVPSLSSPSLKAVYGSRTLKELLGGEQAVLAVIMSGGDYTNSGDFAAPVQDAYLTDGERILGRLPELNISGNLYDMFGKDYLGCSGDKPFMSSHLLAIRMKVGAADF